MLEKSLISISRTHVIDIQPYQLRRFLSELIICFDIASSVKVIEHRFVSS